MIVGASINYMNIVVVLYKWQKKAPTKSPTISSSFHSHTHTLSQPKDPFSLSLSLSLVYSHDIMLRLISNMAGDDAIERRAPLFILEL